MDSFLMYISSFLIIFSYICYFVLIYVGDKEKISRNNGFDICKEMISEYNNINVILNKGYFSIYNIKRKIIKLSGFCYYGKTISSIGLSLLETSVLASDNMKNKYIDMLRKIISNLKIVYILPIVAILINGCTYTIGDVRYAIIFIVLFTFVTYMIIDIKNQGNEWVCKNIDKINGINKEKSLKIIHFINKIMLLDKFIFLGELLIIIRFIGILLEIF